MAVAAAPCEEQDGPWAAPIGEHGRVWWPALSVLPLLLARAAFGSRELSNVRILLSRPTNYRTGWPVRASKHSRGGPRRRGPRPRPAPCEVLPVPRISKGAPRDPFSAVCWFLASSRSSPASVPCTRLAA